MDQILRAFSGGQEACITIGDTPMRGKAAREIPLKRDAMEWSTGEFKVTLAVFSGRPDPEWTVHPRHESFNEIKGHLDIARARRLTHRREHMPARLGFKGFLLHHQEMEHPELCVGMETASLQKVLLDTLPEGVIAHDLRQHISQMIIAGDISAAAASEVKISEAPDLNLRKWNDHSDITQNNNCYNYANDKITNTFAQPGRASGDPIGSMTPKVVLKSAKSDGFDYLEPQPGPDDPCPGPPEGRKALVALVVAEGIDYHWYRLDDNGRWSHKPGQTKATVYDGKGHLIYDPRKAANAGIPYKFVAFMTFPSIKIK